MMSINHLVNIIEFQFEGNKVTPESLDYKIRIINSALEVVEPQNLRIRFSIGKPIDDDTKLDDWEELKCAELSALPTGCADKSYTLYELWYDDVDGVVEAMIYEPA